MPTDVREKLEAVLGEAYVIERELGGGGMSRVFLAEDRALSRRIVIKVLAPELVGAVNVERFVREVRIAARLQHPHVVPLLTAGDVAGVPYYTMPFVAGESLAARLDRDRRLPISAARTILRDIASALACAHREGVVHRDLKPGNVLLTDDRAQVTDFGLAKALGASAPGGSLTGAGFVVGTPAYMAPEQVAADPGIDRRADLYSLGVVGYEMIAGRLPFDCKSPQEMLAAQIARTPAELSTLRPEVPGDLAQLVMRCLSKDPAERPQSAADVVRQLEVGEAPGRRSRHRVPLLVGAAVTTLLAATVLTVAWRRTHAPAQGDAPTETVAVLPFQNLSADKDNEYFSDGMTDELISALANVPGLRVTARGSAFAFKGKNVDVRDVARQLGVAKVVEGSVRRAGNEMRLTTELVDATTGKTLWSRSYQRDASDVLEVQEELAAAMTRELRPALERSGTVALAARPTSDPEAYDLYLRGRYLSGERTGPSLRGSVELFERAIARDSTFALAYVGVADSYAILADNGYLAPVEGYANSRKALNAALAINDGLGEAHATLAEMKLDFEHDPHGAEREYERALALSPGVANVHYSYAMFLGSRGRFDESIAHFHRALEIDPLSPSIGANLSRILVYAGRFDEAFEQSRRVVAANPGFGLGHFWLAVSAYYKGDLALTLAECQRAADEMPGTTLPLSSLAIVRYKLGQQREALQLLHEVERPSKLGPPFPYGLAVAQAMIGSPDRAFAWLDSAYAQRSSSLKFLRVDPAFTTLRRDPRFAAMLAKLRLDS